MAILNVLKYPDKILLKKAKDIPVIDARIQELAKDMIDTMYTEDGVGLAAPQVGISKRMIVVSPRAKRGEERVLINPVILKHSEETEEGAEGCLSVPGFTINVKRFKTITFKALTVDAEEIEETISGFPARVIQHELDHLNGKLLIHHASVDQRQTLQDSDFKTL